jgi:hypothetical protein
MKLLLERGQVGSSLFSLVPLRIGSGVVFKLTAALELDAEEEALIARYNFASSPLVVSDPIDDLKQSFRPAAFLGLLAFIVGWIVFSFTTAMTLAVAVTLVMTAVYFRTLREQIIVSDLMAAGRSFRCESIVDLVKKEAYLQKVCSYLRQVIESAKHWGEREAIEIAPLSKDEAKRLIAKL